MVFTRESPVQWELYLKRSIEGMKTSIEYRLTRISTKTILRYAPPNAQLDVVEVYPVTVVIERKPGETTTDGYVLIRVPRCLSTPEDAMSFLKSPPTVWGGKYWRAKSILREASKGDRPSLAKAVKAYRQAVKILKSVPTKIAVVKGRFKYWKHAPLSTKRRATYDPHTKRWEILTGQPAGVYVVPVEMEESGDIHVPTLHGYLLYRTLCAAAPAYPICPEYIPPTLPNPLRGWINIVSYASAICSELEKATIGYLLTGDDDILRLIQGTVLSSRGSLMHASWYKDTIKGFLESKSREIKERGKKLRAALIPLAVNLDDRFWDPLLALEVYDLRELPEHVKKKIRKKLGTVQP